MIIHPIFHFTSLPLSLSLLRTPPTPPLPPYIRCDSPLCPSPVQRFLFHSRIQFSDSPLIFPPPAHLSFALSSLHLLPSLCTSIALCTQAIKHAHTRSHTSISPCLLPPSPAVCSPYWRLSRKGLATDLIRVSVVAKVESVALRFTAGT